MSDLLDCILSSGIGCDLVHDLYSYDAEDAFCTNCNLSTVSASDVERARKEVIALSQDALRARGPVLRVYRGRTGAESKRKTISVTLSEPIARYHAALAVGDLLELRGRQGAIDAYNLRVADVLGYSEALGRGTFDESEIVCFKDDLRPVSKGRVR